jgi:uncharacterized membrane protein YidH (DUF202 family)
MEPAELALMICGAVLAWVMVSYVFVGENLALIFGESFYIAGTVVYALFAMYRSLMSTALTPISGGRVLLAIPVIIGLLAFTRLTRFRWLARYPITILSGIGIGLFFGLNLRAQIINPIALTIKDVVTGTPDRFSSIIMIIGVVTVLTYFLYSARYSNTFHQPRGRLYYVMRLGRVIFMISIGYLIAFIMQIAFRQVINVFYVAGKRIIDILILGL